MTDQKAAASKPLRLTAPPPPRLQFDAAPLMPESLFFCLPFPPSNNNFKAAIACRGRVRFLLTKEAREYKSAVAEAVTDVGFRPYDGPVYVRVNVYRPRRVGDLDNCLKVVLDCLTGHAYNDDKQIVSIYAHRHEDKVRPRVEVTVGKVLE